MQETLEYNEIPQLILLLCWFQGAQGVEGLPGEPGDEGSAVSHDYCLSISWCTCTCIWLKASHFLTCIAALLVSETNQELLFN